MFSCSQETENNILDAEPLVGKGVGAALFLASKKGIKLIMSVLGGAISKQSFIAPVRPSIKQKSVSKTELFDIALKTEGI